MRERKMPEVWIPVALDLDWPREEQILADLRYQHQEYGFTHFLLAWPSGGRRSAGFPSREEYEKGARLFARLREAVEGEGIQCGWWITATLLSGPSPDFSRMVDHRGETSPHANCPLCPAFRKEFAQRAALFCSIARPAVIMTEDDFSIHAGSSSYGCFCRDHLEEFSRRMGRTYSREELVSLISQGDDLSLLRSWRELMRDSLVDFARELRSAVDESIPIGYMQSGAADKEGDCTMAVSRALAGEKNEPFSRLFGTTYCAGSARDLPRVLYHPLYTKQHHPDLVAYHESDTFPHTLFFMSVGFLRAMMSIVYSSGFVGSVFQTQQLLDDPNEERAYGRMFSEECKRFEALCEAVTKCRRRGVEIAYDPFGNTAQSYSKRPDPLWARPVGLFGIPYVTTPEDVAFWDARPARYKSEEEVKEALSRGLILDGAAARILCERGFGAYLGVEVTDEWIGGRYLRDLAAREVLREDYLPELKGRNLPSPHMYAKGNNGTLQKLTLREEGCEVLSRLISYERDNLGPVVTRFENALGGRVAVLGFTLCDEKTTADNLSQSLYNYRRQAMLQELVDWCGGELACVEGAANLFLVMNEAAEPDLGFLGILTVVNLGEDPAHEVTIRLPERWGTPDTVEILQRDGSWKRERVHSCGERFLIKRRLSFGEALIVKI